MIIDEVKIYLKAGRGGEGDTSTLRLSSRRTVGGGGDGGGGADVILRVSPHLYDLNKFLLNKKFIACDGQRGRPNNKKGKDAINLIVNVPEGTIVKDLAENTIVDLTGQTKEFLICQGGEGGKGNFKKMYSLAPCEGEEKEVILDYRICCDITLLGFPNSGKTSLCNKLTGEAFRVAEYPYTTTSCAWASAEYDYKKFIVLDTPPLKESSGRGGLNKFLKHLERTSTILFLSENFVAYKEEFAALKKEISLFNPSFLKQKKIFYLLTKIDKIGKVPDSRGILPISAEKNIGIEELNKRIVKTLINTSLRESNTTSRK